MALACTTRSQSPAASSGSAKSTPRASAIVGARRVGVDQLDADAGEAGQQRGDRAADHAAADHGDPVADQRRGVPQRVHRGLHRAGQDGPRGGHDVRHDASRRSPGRRTASGAGTGRRPSARRSSAGPSSTTPDVEVAVLHRRREVALLERRPHRGVLALGHPAAEDEGLRATAHPGVQRAHQHLVLGRVRQRRPPGSRRARASGARRHVRCGSIGVLLNDRATCHVRSVCTGRAQGTRR